MHYLVLSVVWKKSLWTSRRVNEKLRRQFGFGSRLQTHTHMRTKKKNRKIYTEKDMTDWILDHVKCPRLQCTSSSRIVNGFIWNRDAMCVYCVKLLLVDILLLFLEFVGWKYKFIIIIDHVHCYLLRSSLFLFIAKATATALRSDYIEDIKRMDDFKCVNIDSKLSCSFCCGHRPFGDRPDMMVLELIKKKPQNYVISVGRKLC